MEGLNELFFMFALCIGMSWYIVEEPFTRRRARERRKGRRMSEGRKLVTANIRRTGKSEV